MNEDTVFCIDTSALVDLHRYYPQQQVPDLWVELDGLLQHGKLISHKIVFDELTTNAKRPSDLSRWVAGRQGHFIEMNPSQVLYVADIVSKFPGLIDPYSEKDQADPWLIALSLDRREQNTMFPEEYAIVSQENILSTCKIPAVCRHYKIKHYDLLGFFDENGWKIGFQKS